MTHAQAAIYILHHNAWVPNVHIGTITSHVRLNLQRGYVFSAPDRLACHFRFEPGMDSDTVHYVCMRINRTAGNQNMASTSHNALSLEKKYEVLEMAKN